MLDFLHKAVRRQDVDHAEVVHRIERLVLLVRRAEPSFVLGEEEVLSVAGVLFGQDPITGALQVRVGVLARVVHRAAHDVRVLRREGRHRASAVRIPVVPVRVRLRRYVDIGGRKDAEGVASDVVAVPALHVVYADEERVIHHLEHLEKLGVAAELLREERTFLGAEREFLATLDPIEVLKHRPRVFTSTVLGVYPTDCAALEIVCLVDILVSREEVVHDHKVNLASMGKFDAVEAIETRKQCMRVRVHVRMVSLQYRAQKLMLGMSDGLDDETVITGEVEERPRFPRRSELGKDVLCGEGKKVVGRVKVEVVFAKFAKDPRGVIFEFEVVSC